MGRTVQYIQMWKMEGGGEQDRICVFDKMGVEFFFPVTFCFLVGRNLDWDLSVAHFLPKSELKNGVTMVISNFQNHGRI